MLVSHFLDLAKPNPLQFHHFQDFNTRESLLLVNIKREVKFYNGTSTHGHFFYADTSLKQAVHLVPERPKSI